MKTFRNFFLWAFVLAVSAFASDSLLAQTRLSDWKIYTSMMSVRAADEAPDGTIWAGTTGGLFAYNPKTKHINEFRFDNALLSLDISAVKIRQSDTTIFVGTSDGVVSYLHRGEWKHITDIRAKQFSRPQINDFLFRDSLLYIAGDFGLTIFNLNLGVFIETVNRFADLTVGISARKTLIAQKRLWVATENGVVSTDIFAPTLANPKAWTVHPFNQAVGVNSSSWITEFQGEIYASGGNYLWKIRNNALDSVLSVRTSFIDDNTIYSLADDGKTLFLSTEYEILPVGGNGFYHYGSPKKAVRLATFSATGKRTLGVFSGTEGLGLVENSALRDSPIYFVAPSCPQSNQFNDMIVSSDGALWNATDINGLGAGIFRFYDGVWTNFTRTKFPELQTNDYYKVRPATDGSVWGSSWGRGMAKITPIADSFKIVRYDSANSPLIGFRNSNFVVMGASATDSRETTWLLDPDFRGLVSLDKQGKFRTFENTLYFPRTYLLMVIDQYGTKWLGARDNDGLVYFNDRNTPDNPNDDIWGVVRSTTYPAIPEDSHTSMAVDKDGAVWVGTAKGLFVISNPSAILSGNKLFVRAISAVNNQFISSLVVDPLNQKWVATSNGAWLFNDDGTTALQQVTTKNAPLTDNSIRSIALDPLSGRIYFGTENGLASAASLLIKANADFGTLQCYPQPFIPSRDVELRIEGLAEESLVKIMTVDGAIIRTIDSRGSRAAVWDGLDERGTPAPSGVYIVGAYSATNDAIGTTKLTLIRQE